MFLCNNKFHTNYERTGQFLHLKTKIVSFEISSSLRNAKLTKFFFNTCLYTAIIGLLSLLIIILKGKKQELEETTNEPQLMISRKCFVCVG